MNSPTNDLQLSRQEAAKELLRRRRARKSIAEYAQAITIPGKPVSSDPDEWLFEPIETSLAAHHLLLLDAADKLIHGELKDEQGRERILFTLKCRKSKQTSNIYHCCFQKTATQWFRMLFSDKIFLSKTGFPLYTPGENFMTEDRTVLQELRHIPRGVIVSPFYITAKNFAAHTANTDYRAF